MATASVRRPGMVRLALVLTIAAGLVCVAGSDVFSGWSIGGEEPGPTRHEAAILRYTFIIEFGEVSNKNLGNAFYNRANAFYALDRHARAIRDYTQALRFSPDKANIYYNRGNSYATLGNHDQAIWDYSQAIQLKPDHDLAFYNRGNSYLLKGDYLRAIEDYKKAYMLNPDDPVSQENMRDLGLLE